MAAASDPGADAAKAEALFDPLRPRLMRIAYRMLGSVADAEDVVQDAYIRWHGTDQSVVHEPAAYLLRVVTRLCLDQLKSARRRRETYLGPWLPEPVVEAEDAVADDVTLPLLMALERLSALERAAFLLHDVFGASFEAVAATLERSPAACRQLASRARTHVRAAKPRAPVPREQGLKIAEAFYEASRTGDMARLQSLLAADVRVHADGGGVRPAALRVIEGLVDVLKLHGALARRYQDEPSTLIRYGLINGLPGFVTREGDGLVQTTALEIEHGRIRSVFVVRNPDKLRRVTDALNG